MNRLRSTLAIVWRIAIPYFRSEDKVAARLLLASVIALQLASVGGDVLINQWRNRFYDALQQKDWNGFVREMVIFSVLAGISVLLAVYQTYLNQWLQIRWRRWMTTRYLGAWMHEGNYYRMQLLGDAADNPDQRLTEDVRSFVTQTLGIGVQLLGSIVSLISFVLILWGLSAAAPLVVNGLDLSIPGYLVWAALIYAVFGTILTNWIGSPLVSLNFLQERYEANFRFDLVRVRENTEQIALLKGERAERARLLQRFGAVVANWYGIMSRTKRLATFTQSYLQAAAVFPFILCAPAFFSGRILLGALMQTAEAFGKVQESLSFFVSVYTTLADWRAVIARLDGFEGALRRSEELAIATPIQVARSEATDSIGIEQLLVELPNGEPLITAREFNISASDRILLSGPSGAGKSTLFRAIAGIWPFGSGSVTIPAHTSLMMLPQRPYFPIGTLKAAIVYPADADAFSDEQVREALSAVGLPGLSPRLDDDEHWNRMLSLGEQQRLGIARALLHAPAYLFLDEATASLDEAAEARLYRLLSQRLPTTTIVSIGHRSTLAAFHTRSVSLARDGRTFSLQGSGEARVKSSPAE